MSELSTAARALKRCMNAFSDAREFKTDESDAPLSLVVARRMLGEGSTALKNAIRHMSGVLGGVAHMKAIAKK